MNLNMMPYRNQPQLEGIIVPLEFHLVERKLCGLIKYYTAVLLEKENETLIGDCIFVIPKSTLLKKYRAITVRGKDVQVSGVKFCHVSAGVYEVFQALALFGEMP